MPDLLLELLSEEIPARMQPQAADDLRRLVTDGLVERGLTYAHAAAFATPRRLTLAIEGLAERSPALREERKGPRADAPDEGDRGLPRAPPASPATSSRSRPDQKGDVLFAVIDRPGRPAAEIVAETVEATRPRLPLAEVHALGRRHPALGPPAALDPLHPDPRDRRRDRAPRPSTASPPATPPAATASTPPRAFPVASFEDYAAKLDAPTSSSTPPSAPRGSPTTPRSSPSPPASSSSTTPASSPRTPASPNGR